MYVHLILLRIQYLCTFQYRSNMDKWPPDHNRPNTVVSRDIALDHLCEWPVVGLDVGQERGILISPFHCRSGWRTCM